MKPVTILKYCSFVALCGFIDTSSAESASTGTPLSTSVSKRYLVRLKRPTIADGFAPFSATDRNERFLASRPRQLKVKLELRQTGFVVLETSADQNANELLEGHPDVEYVEEDRQWHPASEEDTAPPSSQTSSPWMKDVLGLGEANPPTELGSTDFDVPVAVVDTGLSHEHPYFRGGLLVNSAEQNGKPGVDDDGNGYVDDVFGANVQRGNGQLVETTTDHGTHVAGLVKAIRDQAAVVYAAAARVKVMGVRFIDGGGSGSTSAAILGLEYALARGARVVNASWGARGEDAFSQALYDAFRGLYDRDVLSVVAAGNAEGGFANDNDRTPYYPANFGLPGLLSVASVTPRYGASGQYQGLSLSPFSNFGRTTVQLAAPGSYEDREGSDAGVYSAYARYTPRTLYVRKKGTSMAAPVVAGIAGVVRALNPSLTAYEVRALMMKATRSSGLPIESGGVIDAAEAFRLAKTTSSEGAKPEPATKQFVTAPARNVEGDETEPVGGCGSITPPSGPGNPFGGNSMGLVTLLFAVMAVVRRPRGVRV